MIAEADWVRAQMPADWLTREERRVYAAWNSDTRRAEWLAGRLAAKKLLQAELGLGPLAWSVGRDGVAPAINGGDFSGTLLSLSHSAGMGAATLSDRYAEGSAGVDVQRIRPVHPGLCARVFTEGEREQIASIFGRKDDPAGMLLLWSLKEAAIKARRRAWGRSLQSIDVRLTDTEHGKIFLPGESPLTAQFARAGEWWLARAVRPAAQSASDKQPLPVLISSHYRF